MNTQVMTRSAIPPASQSAVEVCLIWGAAVLVALLGSWTCFAAVAGINWALWTAAAAAAFFVIRRRTHATNVCTGSALILACALAASAVVTASAHADALIFLGTAALCGYALLATLASPDSLGPAALVLAPLTLVRRVFSEAAARITQVFCLVRLPEAVPLVRGGAMAALIGAILFLLLSAADPTFANWREAAWAFVASWTFVARDVFFILLAIVLVGTYGLIARAEDSGELPGAHARLDDPDRARISDFERLLVLGAALALYLLFFAVELLNLHGVAIVPRAPGETYAEATHRGFGEMIAAAALCALAILLLDRHALRGRREPRVRGLAWAVIGASLIVVASAYERVRFYEGAYGYTEQRLYVQFVCGAVACGLLLLALELRSRIDLPRWVRRSACVAIGGVALFSYWNPSGWIVQANVDRFAQTGKLDVVYLGRLARLSPDAIPAVVRSLPRLAPADARYMRGILARSSVTRSNLARGGGPRELSWYEWSVRRAAAASALRTAGLLPAQTGE